MYFYFYLIIFTFVSAIIIKFTTLRTIEKDFGTKENINSIEGFMIFIVLVVCNYYSYLLESIPLFIFLNTLVCLSYFDYKLKVVPLYILIFVSIVSIFVHSGDYYENLLYFFAGFSFYYLLYFIVLKLFKVEFIGEGDIYIIGSILAIFKDLESFFIILILASILNYLYQKMTSEENNYFIPFLTLSFIIVFIVRIDLNVF